VPLTLYGLREWGIITAAAALLAIGAAWLGWWWAVVLIAVVWIAVMSFFRDPIRRVPTDLPEGTMLSPADGVVSAVETVERHVATGGRAVVIRIFLSVLNVHVNRAPFDGVVRHVVHTPGKFLNAQTEASAHENESNLITMQIGAADLDDANAERIGVRQVAGLVARRIVCPLREGDRLVRGQKFGMIKFGSTTELILPRPDDVQVRVKKGDKVRGGLTVLAVLPERS
jgi:phosphatidylserine decarboxylase